MSIYHVIIIIAYLVSRVIVLTIL